MRMPEAEVDVTVALVEKLINEQQPDLAGPLRLVANGWDNVIFRLGDDLLVRLPRRMQAARLMINEQRWLPVIAEALPAPVPVPVRVGTPSDHFPWFWTITRWLPGTPLTDVPVPARTPLAGPVAEFLAALHRPAPDQARSGPDRIFNPVRGIPLAERNDLVEEHLAGSAIPEPDRLRELWRQLLETPVLDTEPVWVHGDPHPANLLADHDHLAAVIDFGDLTVGDPATDLATGWLSFDTAGRRAFQARYTELTGAGTDLWQRARLGPGPRTVTAGQLRRQPPTRRRRPAHPHPPTPLTSHKSRRGACPEPVEGAACRCTTDRSIGIWTRCCAAGRRGDRLLREAPRSHPRPEFDHGLAECRE
ncbi:aminoglycoside phosphotransferase family protein [Microlunatus parietis]|uniref:Aminoglycoside phosphotransferase (APT) family kinase protein n=1 Tax=Microlunatus parietis TaxID=682979 RepID=A0A7Y9IA04_9ACTN|nr:aminoglycoside phosphotransferase family protein [Microlunatus parietis]NYE73076.1 aminoglycoside phosphotransferase (APT) family kinase protein [Microlunatus parietis]